MGWLFSQPLGVTDASKAPSLGKATRPELPHPISNLPLLCSQTAGLTVVLLSHKTYMRGSLLSLPHTSLEEPSIICNKKPKILLTFTYIPCATTGHLPTIHINTVPEPSLPVLDNEGALSSVSTLQRTSAMCLSGTLTSQNPSTHRHICDTAFTVNSSYTRQTLLRKSWFMGSNV